MVETTIASDVLDYPWEDAAIDIMRVKSLMRICIVCLVGPASEHEITPFSQAALDGLPGPRE